MGDARDLDVRDRSGRKRWEDDTAKAVAQSKTVSRIETVDLIDTAALGFAYDTWLPGKCDVIVRHNDVFGR